jgi:hypothetical protein
LKNILTFITGKYNKQGLWLLFLMSIFPQHLWTLIFAFRDMSWLIDRTNLWDAIGNLSYGMVYAFFESLVIFGILALIGLFTPARWEVNRRVAFLTVSLWTISIWAMISQLLYVWNIWLPVSLLDFIRSTGRPLVMLYLISLALIVPTVSLPVLAISWSQKASASALDLMDRFSLLSSFYLFLDVLGLVIILIRNLA